MAHPYDVERASELHVEWCLDLAKRMMVATTHQSGPQMRAVMHELRSSMPAKDVLLVANAFPALERGILLDGWSLDKTVVEVNDPQDFCDRVYQRIHVHHFRVPSLVGDVFWLWQKKLEPDKANTIRDCLPRAIEPLWSANMPSTTN